MKRPSIWILAVLAFGILICNMRVDLRERILLKRPAFCTFFEKNDGYCKGTRISGKVDSIVHGDGKLILKVDGEKGYGSFYVYLNEEIGSAGDWDVLTEASVYRDEFTEDEGDPDDLIKASICPDDVIEVIGDVYLYPKATNPGEFDTRTYYENLGIFYGVTATECTVTDRPKFSLKRQIYRIAEKGRKILLENTKSDDFGFFEALLTSRSREVEESVRETLENNFLFSLLSVSGLLVSAIGMMLYGLLRRHFRSHFLCASIPVLLMTAYSVAVGQPLSFVRAVFVYAIRVFAPFFRRSFDLLSGVSVTLIVLLLSRPTVLFTNAILFSLVTVFSTGVILPAIKRYFRVKSGVFVWFTSIVATAAMILPVGLCQNYAGNPYSFLILSVVIPMRTAIQVLLLLGIFVGVLVNPLIVISRGLFTVASVIKEALLGFVEFCENLPFSTVATGVIPTWKLVLYYAIFFSGAVFFDILLLIRKFTPEEKEHRPKMWEKCITFLVILSLYVVSFPFFKTPQLHGEEVRFTMLDVGQGDSVILMTKDRVLVIDNGSSDRDDAGKLLTKALNYYGVETVDALFLSHADFDHTNGLETLLRSRHCTLKKLVIPGNVGSKKSFAKIKTQALDSGIELLETVSGDVLKFGPFSVRVLSPEQRSEKEGNEGSLVLKIEVNGERFLLTGDISSETEKTLLQEEISADILKVPHHGSKYSSSTDFLREVHPKIAFVSYGKRNVYGHPAKETVERLSEQSIELFKTGEQGAVELTVVHKEYKVRYYK